MSRMAFDDDGVIPGHPDDAGGPGSPAGHQMILNILAVDGTVFAINPDEVKAATGDHLCDKGAVEANMGAQRQLAGSHLICDFMRVIHGISSL